MQVLCLGGAGRICRESILDLVQFSDFDRITVADFDEQAGREVTAWLQSDRVDFMPLDITDEAAAVAKMTGYDIVMDGTTISLNDISTRCIAQAGCHGINLNGWGDEYKYDALFKEKGRVHVPGFGMTPGTTNMLAVRACDLMESVESVRVSHGAFRPVAFSPSITETTKYEYDPDLPGRQVFEDGQFKQVLPFARPRDIPLPEPFGTHPQYIIPHSETITLADYLQDKGVKLIEVRGTWPPKNMRLVRAMYEWGILSNPQVNLNGQPVGVLDAIAEYLIHSEQGTTTDLYGYALHVEVIGIRDGKKIQHVLTHTHPASDGSVAEWAGLRAYTRNVGIPMAIGVQLIASRRTQNVTGAVIPERVFRPDDVISELARREILVHETVTAVA